MVGRDEGVGTGIARQFENATAGGESNDRADDQHRNRMVDNETEVALHPAFRGKRILDGVVDDHNL